MALPLRRQAERNPNLVENCTGNSGALSNYVLFTLRISTSYMSYVLFRFYSTQQWPDHENLYAHIASNPCLSSSTSISSSVIFLSAYFQKLPTDADPFFPTRRDVRFPRLYFAYFLSFLRSPVLAPFPVGASLLNL